MAGRVPQGEVLGGQREERVVHGQDACGTARALLGDPTRPLEGGVSEPPPSPADTLPLRGSRKKSHTWGCFVGCRSPSPRSIASVYAPPLLGHDTSKGYIFCLSGAPASLPNS